jgi:formate/nitrite transporter FocA (FNT family)
VTILVGNLLGACVSSAAVAFSGAFTPEQHHAFDLIAGQTVGSPFWTIAAKALFAGWIIALMVWLLPLAEQLSPVIIIILTYFIAAGQLEHVIAGSVEAFYGAWSGATTWGDFAHFVVPTFFGNVVGGVGFVAAICSAEIAAERGESKRRRASRI